MAGDPTTPASQAPGPAMLLAYGLPALPLAALTLPVFIFLHPHYAALGLPLTVLGGVLLLSRLWDGVSDPLVGWLSDRTSGRFGRRRPWLLAGLGPTLLGLWFLLQPPAGVTAAYLLLWSLVLYTGWTMILVPLAAWGAELSADYHQRTRIAGYREGAALAGTLAALLLPVLAGVAAAGQEGEALVLLARSVAVALPVCLLLCLLLVPEPPARPPQALGWRRGAALLAGNGPFRRLVLAYLLNGVANGLPAQLFLFFVQHRLQTGEQAGLLLLAYFAAGLLGVPLWLGLSRRWGKHRVWGAAMLWACAWFALVPLLGPGDSLPFLAICIATGLALGADLILPGAMQADVVDADTASTGQARTGLYFALWGLATKLAVALAALGLTAAGLLGFSPGGPNGEGALTALALLYGLLPIPFKLAAIALLWRWPLTESAQAALRRRITVQAQAP